MTAICCLCVSLKHKRHNIADISEAADKLGQDIDEQVRVVSDCLDEIQIPKEQWEMEEGKFLTTAEKLRKRKSGKERKKLPTTAEVNANLVRRWTSNNSTGTSVLQRWFNRSLNS